MKTCDGSSLSYPAKSKMSQPRFLPVSCLISIQTTVFIKTLMGLQSLLISRINQQGLKSFGSSKNHWCTFSLRGGGSKSVQTGQHRGPLKNVIFCMFRVFVSLATYFLFNLIYLALQKITFHGECRVIFHG